MPELTDVLPPADPDARVDTHVVGPGRAEVPLSLDASRLRLGEVSLSLDDALRATLAWADTETSRDDDALLRLELRSVVSATERRTVALVTSLDGLDPGFRDVELMRQSRGDAVWVDGPTMVRVLAGVRVALDAGPEGAVWQPRGNLELSLPRPDFVVLTEADVRPRGDEWRFTRYRLVETGPDGCTVRTPFGFRAVIDIIGALITEMVAFVFIGVGVVIVTMFVSLIVFDVNSPTLFVAVILATLGVGLYRATRTFRRSLRIEPDALHLPGHHSAVARRDVARLQQGTFAIEIVLHDDRTLVVRCGHDGQRLIRLIETAWGWRERDA